MPNMPPKFSLPRGRQLPRERNSAVYARQENREYKTNSATWRKIRRYQLEIEPLCRHCRDAGRVTPANEVDHVDGNAFNNHPENLASMCKPCHSRKTAIENTRN